MTEQKGEQLTKRVEFVAKDSDQQIATGIVMVPDKVDLQGDFAREETIREFSEQFENFVEAGEAGGGVMHAVWPSEWMSLERNEVLDETADIGGKTVPEGTWIQDWQFQDSELWSLVEDGILTGNSIGAVDVEWSEPMEQDELPDDVDIAEAYPEEELVWELVDGLIREVSTVDIPAVPDAMILETKAQADKRLADHLGNRDGFIEEAIERGHSEGEAERLWDLLNRAVDIEGASDPGKQSMFARAGKAFLSALSGTDDDTEPKTSEASDTGRGRDKEGRTLSKQNRESLFATIDASLDVLQDAGVDHGMARFTDREDSNFDLSEHSAREWPKPDDEEDSNPFDVDNAKAITKEDTVGVDVFRVVPASDDETDYNGDLLGMGVDFAEHDVYVDWRREAFPDQLEDAHVSIYGSIGDLEQATGNVIESLDTVASPTDSLANMAQRIHAKATEETDVSTINNAAGGETPDAEGGQEAAADMTDDDNPMDDAPEWAKSLHDDIKENSKQIEDLADEEEKGGEGGDGDGEGEKALEDAPEWAKELAKQTEKNADQIEEVAKASGTSQQLAGGDVEESNREYSKAWDKTLGLPTEGDA